MDQMRSNGLASGSASGDAPDAAAIATLFFALARDPCLALDSDGRVLAANPALRRALGVDAAALDAEPFADLIHPDDGPAFAALRSGSGGPILVRARAATGEHRWLAFDPAAALEGGCLLLVARDVTDAMIAERRAAEIEAVSGVGSWSIDLETRALHWSAETYAIYGLDPADGLPSIETALACYPPEARAILEPAVDALMARGVPYDLDLPFRTVPGAPRIVRTTAAAEMREGAPIRVYGTFQDVTERRAERQRLADILHGADIGTWEWNLHTGETRFNQRWAEIVGHDLADLEPTTIETWTRFAHPDDLAKSRAALEAHFRGETDTYRCEARMRHRDGGEVWVLDVGRVSARGPDGAPEWMAGAHVDITPFKRQQAALEAARAEADRANRAKSDFLASMSHEIRTPMNGVLGMAELLALETAEPAQRRRAEIIRESGEALLRILNDLLDLSKIEAGKLDLEAAPFSPAELVSKAQALHAPRAEAKGLRFVMRCGEGCERRLEGDALRVLQIVHNLVGNAVKFTDAGSITLDIARPVAGGLEIRVSDTGIGLAPEQIETIFDDFVQAESSTTRRFGGTGLGLSIVRRLVQRMGGRIDVESAPRLGATFRVALPLPDASPCARAAPADRTCGRAFAGLRVLCADDNEINRAVLEGLLGRLGVEAALVADGRSAVEAARRERFDAILLDLSMPDIDGATALIAIRAEEKAAGLPPAPAIAATAHAMRRHVEACLAQGFAAHLAKPMTLESVAAALDRALSEAPLSRL